ncbi:MAG: YbaY family lipoprotein [Gemmatimonadota bacterium]
MTVRSSFPLVALLELVLLGCAGRSTDIARTADDESVLRGSVAYRERVALPLDAVVEVQLLDVSAQDVAAPVIAETTIASDGRQVPFPFEVRYDPGRIHPDRTYAVRATIHSGGRMIFTTDTAYHVITRDNPTRVDLWLVGAAESSGEAGGLQGTAWRLEDLGGFGVLDRVEATLEFPEAGKVVGSGSCNRFFGTVEISGESIKFGPLGSTRMSCVEAVMNQEAKYLKALEDAERFTLEGSTLLAYYRGAEEPLRFLPKES